MISKGRREQDDELICLPNDIYIFPPFPSTLPRFPSCVCPGIARKVCIDVTLILIFGRLCRSVAGKPCTASCLYDVCWVEAKRKQA